MFARKSFLAALVVGLVSLGSVNSAQAQLSRVRIQQKTYDVTIVSEFGIPVRVGIFGFSEKATFRLTFDGGRTGPDVYDQELIGGDRVVIVWDIRGRRLMAADLTVDSDGILVLGPQFAAAARAAAGAELPAGAAAAEAPANDLPRLKLKPKS